MLIHPRYEVPKTYEVTINGFISIEQIKKLEAGTRIEDYTTGKCHIKPIKTNPNKETTLMRMTIYEGHNRQIRKMFEKIGFKVIKLHRISEANIKLGNLVAGEYRRLKPFEVQSLKRYLEKGE